MTGSVIDDWRAQGYKPQMALASTAQPTVAPARAPAQQPQSDPHWWDTAMQVVPEWLGARVENVENVTTQPLKTGADNLGGPVGGIMDSLYSGASEANKTLMNVSGKGLNAMAWAESNLFSRPLSTITQAAMVNNPLYKDGFQPSDFVAMWNHSETLSPGQAAIATTAQNIGSLDRGIGTGLGAIGIGNGQGAIENTEKAIGQKPNSLLTDQGFDIYAQEQNLKANNFWNLGTGLEDGIIQVVGMKGVGEVAGGAAKVVGLKNVAMDAQDLAKARAAADSHFVATTGMNAAGEVATDAEIQAARVNSTGQHMQNLANSSSVPEILNNPLVRDSLKKGTLANILKDTNDFHTVKELVLADHGDRQAIANLMRDAPDHIWSMTNMNEHLATELINKGIVGLDFNAENAYIKTFDKALTRDDRFQQLSDQFIATGKDSLETDIVANNAKAWGGLGYDAVKGDGKVAGAINSLADTPVTRATQDFIGNRAAARSDLLTRAQMGTRAVNLPGSAASVNAAAKALENTSFRYTVLGKVGGTAPVTVLAKWMHGGADNIASAIAGRRSLNMVTLSGMRPNDVIDEMTSYMSSGGLHKLDTITLNEKDALGNAVQRQMPMADYRQERITALAASIGDETKVASIVAKTEKDLVAQIGHNHGVMDHEITQSYTEAIQQARDATMEKAKDKGYMWDNQGRRMILDPQFRSQLANSTMLTDLTAMDRHMTMDGLGVSAAKALGMNAAQKADWGFQQGQRAFRVATLFRPAYTLKNSIAEPLMSAFLAHGAAIAGDGVIAATKDFLEGRFGVGGSVRAATLRTADRTGMTPLARDMKKIANMHANRIDLERSLEQLDADVAKASDRGPAWMAQNFEPLQTERDLINAQRQKIASTLDSEDPGWRTQAAADRFPTMTSLEADHAALTKGLTDPKFPTRLRGNAKSLETRATRYEASGDPVQVAKAAVHRKTADDLKTRAAQWEALTPEQRVAMKEHAANLRVSIDGLREALTNPMNATEPIRVAGRKSVDALTAVLDVKRARQVQRLRARENVRTRQGQKDVTVTYGDTQNQVEGLAMHGSAVMDEFSAHNTQHLTYDQFSFVGTNKAKSFRDGTAVEVKPGQPNYYGEWQYAINRHIRQDPLGSQMIAGKSDAEIADWLHSTVGQNYRDAMKWKDEAGSADLPVSPEHPLTDFQAQKISEMRQIVNEYLPTQNLRDQAQAAEVKASHLAQVPTDMLPSVSGGALKMKIGNQASVLNRAIDSLWKFQATMPEDFFGRFPFAAREYKNVLQRNINLAEGQGARLTADGVNAMKYAARRQALVNTEKTFYTIRRSNNLVAASRYLLVYPQATVNSYVRFGRLALENPGRALIGSVVWNSMYSSFGVDDNGAPVGNTRPQDATHLVFGVPKAIADKVGSGTQITLNTKSLQIIGGDPSPNWTVTWPLEIWSQHDPTADEKMQSWMGKSNFDLMFPYGTQGRPGYVLPGGVPMDTFVPAFVKATADAIAPDSTTRVTYAVSQYKWDLAQWEKAGKQGPAPTPEDSASKAESFSFLLAASKFWLPGSPNLSQGNDSAQPSDSMKAIRDFYDQALKANGGDMDAARQQMMTQHGDWILPLITSSSKSLFSVPASDDAFKRLQDNQALVRQVIADNPKQPAVANVLFGDLQGGTTNPNVTAWMRQQDVNGTALKSKDTLETFAAEVAREKSWDEYTKSKASLDATLIQQGGSKPDGTPILSAKDVPWLKTQWDDYLAGFKADPANAQWNAEYANRTPDKAHAMITLMEKTQTDPNFKGQILASPDPAYWSTMKTYLSERAGAQQMYLSYADKGDNTSANSIAAQWSSYVAKEIAPLDKNFGTIYTRYLDGQDLTKTDYKQKVA